MIIQASKSVVERLKCRVSTSGEFQKHALDSWSIDLFKMAKVGSFAVVMHDVTLFTFIVPLKGIRTFEALLLLIHVRITDFFDRYDIHIDAKNQLVMVLPRSDKSLIGTMNEAKAIIRDSISYDERHISGIDWAFIENEINETPFSLCGYATPHQRLRKLVER